MLSAQLSAKLELLQKHLQGNRFHVHEEAAPSDLPQLHDELWHFSCVVRPLPRFATNPHSPLSNCSPAEAAPDLIRPPSPPAPLPLNQHAQPSTGAASQRQVLHRVFNIFDQNRDGLVSTHEIVLIFQKLGIPQNQFYIESFLARFVTKTAGHVDEQEFCHLYDTICSNTEPPKNSSSPADVDVEILAAFNVFDKDGNGLISPSELQSVLCSLGLPQARQLDACVEMISRVDNNADGHIDFFEFKKLFHLENSNSLISSF